jgi:putative endonuclease
VFAAAFLKDQGYRILHRNFRRPEGEIDLVCTDRSVLCFVEVRSRASSAYGLPIETISRQKRRRLVLAARQYLAAHPTNLPCRFDVVTIEGDARPELWRDAFRLEDC